MKGHTTAGRDIIHRMREFSPSPGLTDFLRITEEITFTHHEKWDGSGYHGLKGDEIPVPGRLMTVADIYDALISPRVYKPAMEHDAVVELIRHGDGRTRPEHFDPDVLQAFLDHHRDFADFAAMNRTESHNLG
jgi:putative two-component system response regulator